MVEIIGVRFQNGGKVYYFSPDSWKVKQGDLVITETSPRDGMRRSRDRQ